MKKTLAILLFVFTIFNMHAQEIEIIEPCNNFKFFGDNGYYYARGQASSSNLEIAKSRAFLSALIELSDNYETRIIVEKSLENEVSLIYSGARNLSKTDMIGNSAEELSFTRFFSISDRNNYHHAKFVNWSWIIYASECKDFEIMCTEILKNEYGDYSAAYVIRISERNAKKLFDGFNDFVDG